MYSTAERTSREPPAARSNRSLTDLNNPRNVAFSAVLDTSTDGVVQDTGLYVWSHGVLRLVARTGMDIPGVGTIARVGLPDSVSPSPLSGAAINNRGQVFFQVTLTDGSGVLLIATPKGE